MSAPHDGARAVEPFQNLDLAEQLRRAMPIARSLIEEGITSDPVPGRSLNEDVIKLTGSDILARLDEDEGSGAALADGFAAGRAIGLALGLLLRPETVLPSGSGR
jgi:hypothetical protein